MASVFTFQEEPPRVHSPWSTSGSSTPQSSVKGGKGVIEPGSGKITRITRLEPERQDGPTEYKLHLLLRSRRKYSALSAASTTSQSAQDMRAKTLEAVAYNASETKTPRSTPHPQSSNQTRQARLQQLTTQLLWRLQQSSPFHSSSNAKLVLPVLPEATPRLGVPDRPAKLLPGLEESQGALYEIGVADDGTLIGLVDEELEESLSNLRAMASSLGCVVDTLRRVLVGQCEWREPEAEIDSRPLSLKLWVAEVLVRPDARSPTLPPLEELRLANSIPNTAGQLAEHDPEDVAAPEQMRVAVVGASSAGKSSLVGTLTTSTLDNGRGRSRLSLLKHRHEVASGVTSSVAQELLGYRYVHGDGGIVVNYASGDVSAWPDIHNLASRLVFLSDSPGLARYGKSIFRSLISWSPRWTLLCVAADDGHNHLLPDTNEAQSLHEQADLSLAHLEICLKLNLQFLVTITKLDLATKPSLRDVLAKVLTALKGAGKTPVLLSSPSDTITNPDENTDISEQLSHLNSVEERELESVLSRVANDSSTIPIVLTSAVSGAGIAKLHRLLQQLPTNENSQLLITEGASQSSSHFHVDEMFAIPPSRVYTSEKQDLSADHGIVLCGHVAIGKLAIGDSLRLGPFWLEHEPDESRASYPTARATSQSAETSQRPSLRPTSEDFSKSLQGDRIKVPSASVEAGAAFVDVTVVSLRSLRLPVRSMQAGETGTVGIQPVELTPLIPLSRARKGMVLSSAPADELEGYRSFVAVFQADHFSGANSPPLVLGGHAIAYVNSVRAAVKVSLIAFHDNLESGPLPNDVFEFDGDEDDENYAQIGITFKFVSSIEYLELGDQVLVVPTVTSAGPVTGPAVLVTGLSGFVGTVVKRWI